jgi:hypothetical protein
MPIWKILSVSGEPETKLLDWRVFEIQQADQAERTLDTVSVIRTAPHGELLDLPRDRPNEGDI